ncbi:MAG TPA: ATP-binding protein [Terriglobales bacterium]|nr:ATP-binding protein [Terriglobales bacterium]
MRSLFLKIFLSFWLAQALFLVLAVLVTLGVRLQRENATWEALQAKVANEAVRAYERGGEAEARQYLDNLQESQQVRAFLFSAQGQEISGGRPPEWIRDVERGHEPPSGFWTWLMLPRSLRQSITTATGHRYTVMLGLPPGPRVFFGPRGIPAPGLIIAVISSGLVCYILARYLTGPVIRLREATQKLAAGDLTARAGSPWKGGRRRDEISQLVRDFDAMAERLESLVKAQSRLLNDISHELRSPLARLNVALELARQRSGPSAESALNRIDVEAERLNELVGRLLTIARLESQEDRMRTAPVDLGELIVEIAADADFEAASRNCRVKANLAGNCTVAGDAALLRSAIENVVRNATRYTQEGTDVEVDLQAAAGLGTPEAVLKVSDSGPGVPEDSLNKLFQPFYRIDDSRGRQTGGVGLGLAITDRAVRLHGGSVKAANRPGGGLVVEIRLPLSPRVLVESVPAAG